MSNGIPSFPYGRVNAYRQALQPQEVQPRQEVTSATPAAAAAPAQQARAAAGLSPAEAQMIDRYFPPSATLSMRLYGPDHGTRTVSPGAVGSRLDLRG